MRGRGHIVTFSKYGRIQMKQGQKKAKSKSHMSNETRKLFEKYYLDFRKDLYWYVYRKVSKTELAEDITADVFMKLLKNPNVIEERKDNEVKAWLYTVARNQVIDYYRKTGGKRKKIELEEEVFELVASTDDNHLDLLAQDEEYQIIFAAMEALEDHEREIINLRFKEDMKFSEISKIVGKNEGAVKMSLYRSLKKLKEMTGERIGLNDI